MSVPRYVIGLPDQTGVFISIDLFNLIYYNSAPSYTIHVIVVVVLTVWLKIYEQSFSPIDFCTFWYTA